MQTARLLQTIVFTTQNENVTTIIPLFSNTENNGLQSVRSLHFVLSQYYIFLERCKFQACPSHLLRNFSGIFGRMGVHVCVCGGAGREKESTGYKQTFKGRLETRKACVCCVLETSGFETINQSTTLFKCLVF